MNAKRRGSTSATCYRARVERTCFQVLAELFAKDVDLDLLARGLQKTPTERIEWLEEMQAFAAAAAKGRNDEAAGAPEAPR